MSTSHWTNADLAQMTQQAINLSGVHPGQWRAKVYYCAHCTVVPVEVSGDLCEGCIEEVCSYLQDDEERYYARLANEYDYQRQFSL